MKKHLGVMLDCSRNGVMKPAQVKHYVDLLVKMGYNTLMLYTEDTYEVENQPLFGYMRGRYSVEEMKDMVEYADQKGVEMIPCIQTLAHLPRIFQWPVYDSMKDIHDILMIDDDRVYTFVEDMIKTLRKCYKTDIIHIGMDEAWSVGLGKHLQQFGYEDRFKLLTRHMDKVVKIAKKYDFKPIAWGDMFFHLAAGSISPDNPDVIPQEVIDSVPKDLELVYWDYFSTENEHYDNMFKAYSKFNGKTWFAGSGITYAGITPHIGNSLAYAKPAMQSCRENCINDVLMTMWGDDGQETSQFTMLPALLYAAEIYNGNEDETSIKTKFKELFNIEFDDMLLLDLPATILVDGHWGTMDKIMLFSDPFLGFYDTLIKADKSEEKQFKEFAERLTPHVKHPEFGYLFDITKTLCEVLEYKYTLGVRTREAYKNGDVKEVIERYKKCEELLPSFYQAMKKRWDIEEKPFGFEVIDLRLGGVKQRLAHCREVLERFDRGEIQKIEELEVEILETGKYLHNNEWLRVVSPNYLERV